MAPIRYADPGVDPAYRPRGPHHAGGVVKDAGPLRGPDVGPHLQHAESFGVTTGRAADGVPTIEFTTDPAVHGPRGRVDARHAASGRRRLSVDVRFGDRG